MVQTVAAPVAGIDLDRFSRLDEFLQNRAIDFRHDARAIQQILGLFMHRCGTFHSAFGAGDVLAATRPLSADCRA